MKRVKIPLVALILMAGLMTFALLIGSLSAPIASATDNGCRFNCWDGTVQEDGLNCRYPARNCSWCELICPEILQPST
jgi:hypothetical protein